MKPTINFDLSRLKEADALLQIKSTVNVMRTNIFFNDPDVHYDDYDTAISDYDISLTACRRGSTLQTAIKDKFQIVLYDYYKYQGLYVIRKCKGNLEKLISSNYEIALDKGKKRIKVFTVKNGNKPGKVMFTAKSTPKFRSFLIECRIVSATLPNKWEFCKVIGGCKGNKSGFISGLEYEFRIKAIFRTTEGPWLDSIILRIG